MSPRTKRVLVFLILGLAFALPLRGLLRNQGPPMEEGFMLVFPERVLAGDIPNLDFLHLYGPGSLWALAGWMKIFGVTLEAERLFGRDADARRRVKSLASQRHGNSFCV